MSLILCRSNDTNVIYFPYYLHSLSTFVSLISYFLKGNSRYLTVTVYLFSPSSIYLCQILRCRINSQEEHGHCIVPQSAGSLGEWVKKQRAGYKLLMAGKPTNLTHEKALRLSSIGFCFDASSRFKGKIRTVS